MSFTALLAAEKQVRLYGLLVLSPAAAIAAGMVSITTDVSAKDEARILASLAQHRDPHRACWVLIRPNTYQLCIHRSDVSNLAE